MSRYVPSRLPDTAPVLISKLLVGHRPGVGGKPACGSDAPVHVSTVKAAWAFNVGVCSDCWGGGTPW